MPALLTAPAVTDATRREFLAALAAAGLLTGCGRDGAGDGVASMPTRPVEHARGTTEVPVRPARVATDNEAIISHLAAVGLLTVTGPDYIEAWLAPIADLLDPALDVGGVALIGERANPALETMAAARPDLIVVETNTGDELYDELTRIAPTVVIDRGPNSAWKDAFTRTVEAAGRAAEAEAVRAGYEQERARSRERVGDRTVSFVRASSDGNFTIDGTAGFAGSVARDAGITVDDGPPDARADESGLVTLSGERLDVISGDIVVAAGTFGITADEEGSVEQLARNPLWAAIPAVAAGRVLTLPGPVYNGASYLAAQRLLARLADFAE